jgi:hypothetical protein
MKIIKDIYELVASHEGAINDELMDKLNDAYIDARSWQETHYEIVQCITMELQLDKPRGVIGRDYERHGTGAMYDLACEWTDEFEETYTGCEWDGEFFDTIEDFVKRKNMEQ